ncbi:hypothetical protein ACFPK9_11680 [Rubritalea spongiae]|uniref:DUF4178 domain-containing protein n=1 Tax=Rubritalea spongiae TaxID=430797 RepID=A0ABW5DYX5_9BACT
MATEKTSIREGQFHCVRCNAVFSAPLGVGKPSLCSLCGKSPQHDATYASVADITAAVDRDGNHGVPGKDIADFVSMKMVRRKRQVRFAVASWLFLLIAVAGGTIYFQNTRGDSGEAKENQMDSARELREKTADAYKKSLVAYKGFISTDDFNQRSEYVVDGVSKLLKMQYYYEQTVEQELRGGMTKLGVAYKDDGEFPRIELLAEDAQQKPYELVFWNKGDGWKLDWEQHVRYQDADWTEFLFGAPTQGSWTFKLYVRRRYSSQDEGELKLIFYQPKVVAGVRYQESPQVTVSSEHPSYLKLKEAFDAIDVASEDDQKRVIRKKDSTGLIRVKAALSYKAGEDGERELQLDEVKAFHWMEYDPVKAED